DARQRLGARARAVPRVRHAVRARRPRRRRAARDRRELPRREPPRDRARRAPPRRERLPAGRRARRRALRHGRCVLPPPIVHGRATYARDSYAQESALLARDARAGEAARGAALAARLLHVVGERFALAHSTWVLFWERARALSPPRAEPAEPPLSAI